MDENNFEFTKNSNYQINRECTGHFEGFIFDLSRTNCTTLAIVLIIT